MDIIEALRTRHSTKNFSQEPVSLKLLSELVDISRHSPSGSNKNPWRFILITERKTLDHLSQAHPYCGWLASAQAGIAIVVDPASSRYWLEDCCLAAYSIWLAGMAHGLGTAWAAMYQSDNTPETERRQKFVRQILSVPDKLQVPMVLGIGFPMPSSTQRKLPEVEEIVFREYYSARDK